MEDRFYRPREAYLLCGISESFARRDHTFPKAVVLTRTRTGRPARVVFLGSELQEWRTARVAQARAQAPLSPEAA